MNIMYKKLFVVLCIALVPSSSVSAKSLTKQSITAFVERTTKITSGSVDSGFSRDKTIAYLNKHIEKEARFKTLMRFDIPGQPPQESMMRMGKKEFIEKVRKGVDSIDDYDSTIEVLDIIISRDGRVATVRTRNAEGAMVPVQNESGGITQVPMDGVSYCTQILRLSDKNIIQMYNASCITDIAFTSFGAGKGF